MLKRTFDIVFSSFGLLLLLPILLLTGIVVRFSSVGPVLYKSRRVGLGGTPFNMYKFRTMIADADRQGPLVTVGDDWRVTRVGRFLRKSKLDELPALWNVLIGEMSVVGPRPENPLSASLYSDRQRQVFTVRPGITSPASIKYRYEEELLKGVGDAEARYIQILQDKLELDIEYINRQSLWKDLKVIFGTFKALAQPRLPYA